MKAKQAGPFTVIDFPPVQPGWDFWPMWSDGRWESGTREVIAKYAPGSTYVDIGAWVGPTVLWAAEAGAECIAAYEPDPVAFGVLRANVALNGLAVECHEAAVTADGDDVRLLTPDFGESTTGSGGEYEFTARGVSVADACTAATFVKVDIEGAEIHMLDQLAAVGCPMLVSLHAPWWPPGSVPDFSGWSEVRVLEDGGGFGEVLCLP